MMNLMKKIKNFDKRKDKFMDYSSKLRNGMEGRTGDWQMYWGT